MSQTVHCQRCGYDLAGLDLDGVCPECAHPVGESYAAPRPGSAWQREPSLKSWAKTGAAMCARPQGFWADVALEFPGAWNLLVVNVLIASYLIGAGYTAGMNERVGVVEGAIAGLIGGIFMGIPVFVVLFLLTNLQMAIVRALAPGSGRMAVRAAVAHASFLWILAAPAALLAMREPILSGLLLAPALGVVWLGAAGARRLRYVPEPVA